MSVLWDTPTADDVRELIGAWNPALAPNATQRFCSLVDARGLKLVDHEAFAELARYLDANRDAIHRLVIRQALIRPGGVAGAVVAGFVSLLEYQLSPSVFTDAASALEWIAPDHGARAAVELDRFATSAMGVDEDLRKLRRWMRNSLPGGDLRGAARHLGFSTRSLQRRLAEWKTSFQLELITSRVALAEELLVGGGDKIATIARRVGCQSEQHFITMFRRRTGETPARWRARNRL